MDKSVDPCVDFYTYSCGGWQKKNPIPADQSSWSVYGKLYDDNQQFLWGILDDLSKQTTGRTPTQQKIGDYFAACMDEAAVEKLGATPLKPQLDAIAAMKSKKDLAPLLAKQQLENRTEACCSTSARTRILRTPTRSSPSPTRAGSAFPIATIT